MGQFAKGEVIGVIGWVSCANAGHKIARSGKGVTVRVRVQREPRQQAAAQPRAAEERPAWFLWAWELGRFSEARTAS